MPDPFLRGDLLCRAGSASLLVVGEAQAEAEPAEFEALHAIPLRQPERLIVTKLAVPTVPRGLVARPRLLGRLTNGAARRLTVLTGPAGSGKSVLLSSWAAAGNPPGPIAWVSLDRGDAEPFRFWSYVLEAVRSRRGGEDGLLASLTPPDGVDEAFLGAVINGLAALSTPMVLVLDDFHLLDGSPAAETIEFLLRRAPRQLRIVIGSRRDPLRSQPRLRLSDDLTEIRAADLAFTDAEVADLFASSGLHLTENQRAVLTSRTEGWAAAVRLAALSLQGGRDPAAFVAEFGGTDRSVAGYLAAEVLESQPAELREFLLRTSVADEFTPDLGNALTERSDAQRLLSELERDNCLLIPLGTGWYRYHHLFAELLREQLRRSHPDEVASLRRIAARWYAAEGRRVDAVQQAVAAADWPLVSSLLERFRVELISHGEGVVLRDVLNALPADLAGRDPQVALALAANRATLGDVEGMEVFLDMAASQLGSQPAKRQTALRADLLLYRSVRARIIGDLHTAADVAQELLSLRAADGSPYIEDDGRTHAFVLSNLGTALFWTGDFDQAEIDLRETAAVAARSGNEYAFLNATAYLALLAATRGQLWDAFRAAERAVEFAEQRGWKHVLQIRAAYLALAIVHLIWDDSAAADSYLDRAAHAWPSLPERPSRLGLAIVRAQLRRAAGASVEGLALLRAAREHDEDWTPPPFLAEWVRLTRADLSVASGDVARARALVAGPEGSARSCREAVVHARLALADGDPTGALRVVRPWLAVGRSPSSVVSRVEAWVETALAHHAAGSTDRSRVALAQALTLAEPERMRSPFLRAGPAVEALLRSHGPTMPDHRDLVDDLLERLGRPIGQRGPAPAEVLSSREREVLRYLPTTMTTAEIAAQLYVSTNTVKTHIGSIYRKLGRPRRQQAVTRARELGLL